MGAIIDHLKEYWDAHMAAGAAMGISLSQNVVIHLENIAWSVLSGLIVFLVTQGVKKLWLTLLKK